MPNLTLNLPTIPTVNAGVTTQNAKTNVPDIGIAMAQARAQLSPDLQPAQQSIIKDYYSPLSNAMRYTDPGLGYNPFDYNIEDKYANAHPWTNLGKNVVKAGGEMLGAAAETLATIPMALYGAFKGDLSKTFNNPFINTINNWNAHLEEALPTYTTNYEQQHPISKFFGVGGLAPLLGGVGNTIRATGTMGGFIAGTVIQDAVIGALTGGVGLPGAFVENAGMFSKIWGRMSRLFATEPEILAAKGVQGAERIALPEAIANGLPRATTANIAEGALQTGVQAELGRAATQGIQRSVGEGILGAEATNVYNTLQTPIINKIKQRILNTADLTKVTDGIRYNFSLLTNSIGMGIVEANSVYNGSKQQMTDAYYQQYGTMPDLETANKIDQIATKSARITMYSNVALQYFSSRINWGSLFKPNATAKLGTAITGFGKKIGTNSVTRSVDADAGTLLYKVEKQVPETTIGKILLHGERVATQARHGLIMGANLGVQSGLHIGALNYAMRQYDVRNTKQAIDGVNEFLNGVTDNFTTIEGWDGIITGILAGGIIGGGVNALLKSRGQTERVQTELQNQANALNANTLKSVIDQTNKTDSYIQALNTETPISRTGLEGQIGHIAAQKSMAEDYAKAITADDVKAAKDLQSDLAFNYWHHANKQGIYEMRKEEFEAVKNFEGEAFKNYWGLEDIPENRTKVAAFIQDQLNIADYIKRNGDAVKAVARNPYNSKTEALMHAAYENRNDALARAMTRVDVGDMRLKQVINSIKEISPSLNIQTAADLTSVAGIRNILTKLRATSDNLAQQIEATQGDVDLNQQLVNKKQAIDDLFSRAQPLVTNSTLTENGYLRNSAFQGTQFLDVMRDLYNLHSGSSEQNAYLDEQLGTNSTIAERGVNYDQLAQNLQRLQDVRQLAQDKLDFQRLYNHYRTDAGAREFVNSFVDSLVTNHEENLNADGTDIINPQQEVEQARAEEQANVIQTEDLLNAEEQTPGTADRVKEAAQKRANGEPLTAEEQQLADTFNEDFTAYTKAELNVKQRVNTTEAPWNVDAPSNIAEPARTVNNRQFKAVTPEQLALSLFKNKQFILDSEVNTHNLIFNTHNLNDIGEFSGVLTRRPELNLREDETIEDRYQRITDSELYRAPFEQVVRLNINGKEIGEIRPSDSVFYLDTDANYVPLIENGKLNLPLADYERVTGNAKSSYNSFKDNIELYDRNYKAFLNEVETNGGQATDAMLAKYFNVSVNAGSAVQNSAKQVVNDTPLNKLNIQNKAVVSIIRNADGEISVNLAKNFGLNESELQQIENYANTQRLDDLLGADKNVIYAAVFPQLGQIRDNSFVIARNVKRGQAIDPDNITQANTKVVSTPNVYENYTIDLRPKADVVSTEPIAEQTDLAQPQFAQNKAGVETIAKNLFNYSDEQANAAATLFDQQAQAWVARNPGKTLQDFYNTLSFGDRQLFDQTYGEDTPAQVQFSKAQQSKIQAEVEDIKTEFPYNAQQTNLPEQEWYVVNTPTFIKYFGDWRNDPANASKAVDANGHPQLYFHGSAKSWEVFNPEININKPGSLKTGALFLSPEPEFAAEYVGKGGDAEAGVRAFFVNTRKPFDYENPADLALLKEKNPALSALLASDNSTAAVEGDLTLSLSENYGLLERPAFQQFIKENGYDGFYVKEWDIKNIAVYKPQQAKVIDSQAFDNQNPNVYYQTARQAVDNVIKGFKLTPQYVDGIFNGFKTEGGSTSVALKDAINRWAKDTDQAVEAYVPPGANNVFLRQLNKGVLNQDARGAYDSMRNTIYALTNPDITTFPHELAHAWEANLTTGERQTVLDWANKELTYEDNIETDFFDVQSTGETHVNLTIRDANGKRIKIIAGKYDVTEADYKNNTAKFQELKSEAEQYVDNLNSSKEWTTDTSEAFAKGFEAYLTEGNKTTNPELTNIFQKFAKWLADAAKNIKQTLGLELNDGVRDIYAKMLNSEHVPVETKTEVRQATEAKPIEEAITPLPEETPIATTDGEYTTHQIGDYYIVEKPNGDITDEFETAEQAQDYINAQRAAVPEQVNTVVPEQANVVQPTERITLEQPAQQQDLQAITPKSVKIGKADAQGVYNVTRNGETIGRMLRDPETTEWVNPDINPDEAAYYLGDTRTEALEALVDDYNDRNNLITASVAEAPQTYHTIKVDGKPVAVRLTKADVINTFEDVHGHTYEDATLGQPATEADYKAQTDLVEKPTPKYAAGDYVKTSSGDNFNIVSSTVRNVDGGYKVFYKTDTGNTISQDGITRRVAKEFTTATTELTAKQKKYNDTIQNVAKRFSNVFGNAIKLDANVYDFDAPAKFENGRVLINLGYIERHPEVNLAEAVSHEYMHPFALALKMSNKALHTSLIEELNTNHKDIIAHVEKLYKGDSIADKQNEALATYLGRELGKAFTPDGRINVDYVKQRPLLERFVTWLKDIVNTLTGKTKAKTLDEFVKDVNTNKAIHTENIKTRIANLGEENEAFKKQMQKVNGTLDKKLGYILNAKNAEKLTETLGKEEFTVLRNEASNYRNNLNLIPQDFNIAVEATKQRTVEFTRNEDGQIQVKIDPEFAKNASSMADVLAHFAQNSEVLTDAEKENFADLVHSNLYTRGNNEGAPLRASDLNPLFKLQDTSNFILYQLGNSDIDGAIFDLYGKELKGTISAEEQLELDQLTNARDSYQRSGGTAFDYTTDELDAISQLNAYMKLDPDWAKRARARVTQSIDALRDIAEARFKSEPLRQEYVHLNLLNKEFTNDVEFMQNYAQIGADSLTLAYRKWREIINDTKTTRTQAQLNALAKSYNEVTNLLGLYKEFSKIADLSNFNIKDADDMDTYVRLQSGLRAYNAIHNSIQDTAIDLTVKWFEPRIDLFNKNMQKNGYTEEAYKLTPEILRSYFKYGTEPDTNLITHWLGANISSRSPINALFANTVSDAISVNHAGVVNSGMDVNIGYSKFIKQTGLSGAKDQQDYYVKNYLRKASVKTQEYDKLTNTYKDVYVDKYALHQQYYWDAYYKDLEAVEAKYADANTMDQYTANQFAIKAWKDAQGYRVEKDGTEHLTNSKYVNKEYTKLQNDEFFKLLETKYNDSNKLYGDDGLRFGVIPQQYDQSFMDRLTSNIKEVKGSASQREAVNTIVDKLKKSMESDGSSAEKVNLDETLHRSIRTNLTKIKADENIQLNLPSLMVDFIEEANHYGVLKNTQFNANILMSLLEGNTFLGIKARDFAKQDQTRMNHDARAVREARRKLADLDARQAAGEQIDAAEYNAVKAASQAPIVYNNVFDKALGRVIPRNTQRNNQMLINQIKDIYYQVPDEDFVILKHISAKKLASKLSYYTSVLSLSGNTLAAISNVTIGNAQLWIEANGGQYFTKKDVAKATGEYTKNIGQTISDLSTPIKSKQTQLLIQLDAIQGEIRDNFGRRITGNLASKLFNWGNLFLLTRLGEHQIQSTNMLAMLMGRKVQTNAGETISLYDAYIADKDGRYSLRKDIKFNQQDLTQFISELHSVNRALNGNYSDLNKSMLQYKWYGNAALKFRKYIYDAFRTRWSTERTDYERNTQEVGYLNQFFTKYIPTGLKGLIKGNIDGFKTNSLKPHEQYAVRKAFAEVGIYAGISLLAMAIFAGPEKKELTTTEKALILQMARLRSDLGMFSFNIGGEAMQQAQNPTATLRAVKYMGDFFQQLGNPNETYAQKSLMHDQGDSKLGYKFNRMLPFNKAWQGIVNGKFSDQVSANLSFQPLVNNDIEGVTPRSN